MAINNTIEDIINLPNITRWTLQVTSPKKRVVKTWNPEKPPTMVDVEGAAAEYTCRCIFSAYLKDEYQGGVTIHPVENESDRIGQLINGFKSIVETQSSAMSEMISSVNGLMKTISTPMEINKQMFVSMEQTYQERLRLDAKAHELEMKRLESHAEEQSSVMVEMAEMKRMLEESEKEKPISTMLLEKAMENPEKAKEIVGGVIEIGYEIFQKVTAKKGLPT